MGRVVSLMRDIKNDIDIVIHLGDNTEDAEFIRRHYSLPVYNVAGNCDNDSSVPFDDLVFCENKKILITHGHLYNVKYNADIIIYRALEAGADICLFGHTHESSMQYTRGVVVMNPGSISVPRSGSKPSYGIIKIENGEIYPSIVEYKT